MKYIGTICTCLVLATSQIPAAEAAEPEASQLTAFSADPLFGRGRYELALNNGVLFSPFVAVNNRPTIDYTLSEVQFGYMVTKVKGENWLRGNVELVGDGFGSAIFDGPGSYIAGGTAWGRYNFVRPSGRLVPYVQAGAGLTATDIPRRFAGQTFQFNLGIGLGVRYFFWDKWALNAEYRYQHVSNADTGRHNLGVNAHGPILGISYLF